METQKLERTQLGRRPIVTEIFFHWLSLLQCYYHTKIIGDSGWKHSFTVQG